MIRITADADGLTITGSLNGTAIYLDNWAIGYLAEGDLARRKRFIAALQTGRADLLFSVTNAAELCGPQGQSAEVVSQFLDEIGPRWVPVELSPIDVINRELAPRAGVTPCFSERFTKAFIENVLSEHEPGSIADMSSDFFRLGAVLKWVGPQRESLRNSSANFDSMMRSKMAEVVYKAKHTPGWLDLRFPNVPFDPFRPAFFVFQNLLRILANEGGAIKKGDGMDFCHAVIASAYGSIATLDKRWKRRVEVLPQPNRLARVYGPSELDQMIDDLENWLVHTAA